MNDLESEIYLRKQTKQQVTKVILKFFEKERKEKSSLGTLGQWSLLGMKEGLLSFLNLEVEEDASKLHFPSSMRSYKLQHTYKHNVK
jgi:hypothetical protein